MASDKVPMLAEGHRRISDEVKHLKQVDLLKEQRKYVDLVIPRGGEELKDYLLEHSKVPVIYAAGGNCHVYVDASADLDAVKNNGGLNAMTLSDSCGYGPISERVDKVMNVFVNLACKPDHHYSSDTDCHRDLFIKRRRKRENWIVVLVNEHSLDNKQIVVQGYRGIQNREQYQQIHSL